MPHHGEGPHLDDHDHDDHKLDDHKHDDHDHEGDEHHDEGEGDRAGGWAGVPEALGMPETVDTETDAANRPAGPDYAADDRPPSDPPASEPR